MRHATLRFALATALLLGGCATASKTKDHVPPLGSKAPDFTLPDAHGGTITLSEALKKGPVVLVFYLGYSCPRCVSHLREMSIMKDQFDGYRAQIFAIGPDSVQDTQDSIESYGDFPFPMLCDPDLKVYRQYGTVEGTDMIFHGIFIIDTHGVVRMGAKSTHPIEQFDRMLACLKKVDSEGN